MRHDATQRHSIVVSESMLTRTHRRWRVTVALIASIGCLHAAAVAEPESPRSVPPDQTPYVRPGVPEDIAPFRETRPWPQGCSKGGREAARTTVARRHLRKVEETPG